MLDLPEERKELERQAKIDLAKQWFFAYCHLKSPDFYKDDRDYLKLLCDTLEDFPNSSKKVLLIDLPPRHGKSRTAQLFVEWSLGRNHNIKIMTGSYNDTLSTVFAKNVRNSIQEIKGDRDRIVYSDIFPGVRIKPGDGAMNMWSLEDGYNNYLATSPKGTATGFGADYIIIDDLIKNDYEAHNETILQQHWEWFTNTMYSRLEEGGKIIVIMIRWATNDFAGRILEHFGNKVEHINMAAIQPDGTMLCDEILSRASCEEKKRAMGVDIFNANYQQQPIDIKGRLYSNGFKTYDGNVPEFKQVCAYIDTADTGSDYLAGYVYGRTFQDEAYILDVIFTAEPMEVTEPATADMLWRNDVNVADIESNNGGRGFARNVERILRQDYRSNKTSVRWFTQTHNKVARILTASSWCMEHVYFPAGWQNRWPQLYEDLIRYQRTGKNAHDDAEDALSGIYDKVCERKAMHFNAANIRRSNMYI